MKVKLGYYQKLFSVVMSKAVNLMKTLRNQLKMRWTNFFQSPIKVIPVIQATLLHLQFMNWKEPWKL